MMKEAAKEGDRSRTFNPEDEFFLVLAELRCGMPIDGFLKKSKLPLFSSTQGLHGFDRQNKFRDTV